MPALIRDLYILGRRRERVIYFTTRFFKNVVSKQVEDTVAVFVFVFFFFHFSNSKRAQLPAIRITEQPILLRKRKINRPGYKVFSLKTGCQISYLFFFWSIGVFR